MEKHILERVSDIMNNLATANVEEVTELLNYYNGPAVIINGTAYHPFNDPMMAARLNARYHELTGKDHPRFIEQAPKVIDGLLADKDALLKADAYTPMYFERLIRIKNNITKQNDGIEITEQHHPLQDFGNVLNHLSTATLEEVTQQLNYYNGPAVVINGTAYHPFNDPMTAARFNARYHELTGKDHPRFVEQAPKVIDGLLANKDTLLRAGVYTPMHFDRLNQIKAGLTQKSSGIEITEQHHPLQDFNNVLSHLDTATLEEVTQQLNYYNGPAVMINGTAYHPFNDPMTAARFNARYHELTGKDHPRFVEQAPKVIDGLLSNIDTLLKADAYTPMYFERLIRIKNNIAKQNDGIEITEQHHPLQDFNNVLSHLDTATLEEVTQQLNYYNGPAVMINGIAYHPFNDPMAAAQLNTRYHKLTGKDHPRFIEQAPKVIDGLLADKDALLSANAYSPEYFERLEQIYTMIENNDLTQSTGKGVGR